MKLAYLPALALAALLATLCACSSPRITMQVASQPNVNPDNSGRPSPVIVKVYEMRGDLAFRQSDFQTLFETPMRVLGASLVAADELTFVPGEARVVEYAPMPETRYVGVLAGFRQMERAKWRAVIRVDPEDKNLIRLELNDTSMISIDPSADWSPEESVRSYQERLKEPERPAARKTSIRPVGSEPEEVRPQPDEHDRPGAMTPRSRRTR